MNTAYLYSYIFPLDILEDCDVLYEDCMRKEVCAQLNAPSQHTLMNRLWRLTMQKQLFTCRREGGLAPCKPAERSLIRKEAKGKEKQFFLTYSMLVGIFSNIVS